MRFIMTSLYFRFLFGVCFGILTYHLLISPTFTSRNRPANSLRNYGSSQRFKLAMHDGKLSDNVIETKHDHQEILDLAIDEHHHNDNTTVADELKKKVKVFCVISAKTIDLPKKSNCIHKTWAKRCTQTVFVAHQANTSAFDFTIVPSSYPLKILNYKERMFETIRTIYRKFINTADWFYFATDENYVLVENLRHFLSNKNGNMPSIFGEENLFQSTVFSKPGLRFQYNTFNTGFLLSKAGLQVAATADVTGCKQKATGNIYLDLCLYKTAITKGNTKDENGREMFNCIPPEHLDILTFQHGTDLESVKPVTISDYAISFCMVNPPKQLGLEFNAYHLAAYGIIKSH